MGALYSAVSGLLAVISRAYPQYLSLLHHIIYSPGSNAVTVVLNHAQRTDVWIISRLPSSGTILGICGLEKASHHRPGVCDVLIAANCSFSAKSQNLKICTHTNYVMMLGNYNY